MKVDSRALARQVLPELLERYLSGDFIERLISSEGLSEGSDKSEIFLLRFAVEAENVEVRVKLMVQILDVPAVEA